MKLLDDIKEAIDGYDEAADAYEAFCFSGAIVPEVRKLVAEYERLRAALESVQWANFCRCPLCEGLDPDVVVESDRPRTPVDHTPDCVVGKALRETT